MGGFDDEPLFTAFMMHDPGLTDDYRLDNDKQQCFTSVGAHRVSERARKHNWSDKRISIAENAIALHLNVMVSAAHGKEAQMLRIGSGGDVAGLGLDLLHQDQIHAVRNKYPRYGLKREMRANLK